MASYGAPVPQPTLPSTGSSVTAVTLVQIRTRLATGLPDGYRCVVLEVSSGKSTLKSSLWTVSKGDVFCEFWARLQYPLDGKIEVKVTPTAPLGRAKLFYRVRDHAVYATLDLQADAVDAAEAHQGCGHEGAGGVWRSVTLPLRTRTLGDLILGHHQEAAPVIAHLQMDYCVFTMRVDLSHLPELELLCPLARPLHSYAHGGFMGAALSMMADPQWATMMMEIIGEEDAKMLGHIRELTSLRNSGNTFARREMLPLMLTLENSPLLCAYGLVRSGCTKPPSEAAVLASSTVHLLAPPPYIWQTFDLPPSCVPRMLQPLLALQQQEQLQQPLGTGPNFNRYGYAPLGLEWDLWLSPDDPADLSHAVVDHGSAGDLVQQAIAMALRCHTVAKSMGRRHNRMHGISPSKWLVDFATALNLAVMGRAQHPLPLWGPPRSGAVGAPLVPYEDGAACPTLESYLRVGIASLRIQPPRQPYTSAAAASLDLPNVGWLAVRVKVVGNTHTHSPLWMRKFTEAELEGEDAPPAVAGVKAAESGPAASRGAPESDKAMKPPTPVKRAKEYTCADLEATATAPQEGGTASQGGGAPGGFGWATLYPVESGDLGRSFVLLEVYNMFASPSPVARALVPLHALEGQPNGTITLTSVLRPRKQVRGFKRERLEKVTTGTAAGGTRTTMRVNPAVAQVAPLPPAPPPPPPPAPPPPPPVPPAPSQSIPPMKMQQQHPLPQESHSVRQLDEIESQRLNPPSPRNCHVATTRQTHGPLHQQSGQQHRPSTIRGQSPGENGPTGSAPPPSQRMLRFEHGTCARVGHSVAYVEAEGSEAYTYSPGAVIGTSRQIPAAPGPLGEGTELRRSSPKWDKHSLVPQFSGDAGPSASRSETLGSQIKEGLMLPAFLGGHGAAVAAAPRGGALAPQQPPVSRSGSMPHVGSSSMARRIVQVGTMPRLQHSGTLPALLNRASLGLRDIAELELQRDQRDRRFSADGNVASDAAGEGGAEGVDELSSDAEEDEGEGEYEDAEEGIPGVEDATAAGGVATLDASHVVISSAGGGFFLPPGRGAVVLTLRWETLTVLQAAQQLYKLPPHLAQSCTAMMSSPGGLFLDIKSSYSKAAHLRSFASTLAGIGVHVKAICSFVPRQIDFGDQPRPSDPKPAIANVAEADSRMPDTAAAAEEPAPAADGAPPAAVAREVISDRRSAAPIQVPPPAAPHQSVAGVCSGMLGKLTAPGPRTFDAVLFFHGLNGLQLACEAGRIAPGTCVLFNGASMLLEDPGAAIAPPPPPSKGGEEAQVDGVAEGEMNPVDKPIQDTEPASPECGDQVLQAKDNSNGRCRDATAICESRVHSRSAAAMDTDDSNHLEAPATAGQPTTEAAGLPSAAEAAATRGIHEGFQAGSAPESGSPAMMCADVSKRGGSALLPALDDLPALVDREAWLRYITVVDIFKIYGGIYVQEPDCCPAAVDALIQLTNKNPGLLPLGFAYGHLGSKAVAVAGHVGRGLAAQQILEELSSRKALSDKVCQWITDGVHVGASDQVYLSWGRRLLTGTETLWMREQELLLRLLADYDRGASSLLDEGADLLRLLDGLGGFKFVFSRFHKHYEATSPFTFLEVGFNFNYTKALLRLLRNRGALAAMSLSEKVDTAMWLATDSSLRLWVQRCFLRAGLHKHIKEALVCLLESCTQQEFEEICKALGGFCTVRRILQGVTRVFGWTYLRRIHCAQDHWADRHPDSSLIVDGACTYGFIRYARRLPGGAVALGQGLEEAIAAFHGEFVKEGTGGASSSEVTAGIGEEGGIMPAAAVKWYQRCYVRQPQVPTVWLAPDGVTVTLDPRHTRDKVWMLKLWRLVHKVFCCAFTWYFQHCLCLWTFCCSFIFVCPILWQPYCRTRLLPLILSLGAVGFYWFLVVLTIIVTVHVTKSYNQTFQTASVSEPPFHLNHPPPSPYLDGNDSSIFSPPLPLAILPPFPPGPP
ncbi:hypothetical protein Vretimale_3750 [Volvox reticuliferus]|uniref:Uncharacterized protein n=1 Tax=Volvox reticuliferus TaxID=1737510 RepID=A0A8J4DCD9_9CHLO|nr:hypothetical protein Vretifemale_1378 [Volvox reticuliferus]GIL98366.1 hypothetical protein Vretimale_3750 [Volvox reticuliferus]